MKKLVGFMLLILTSSTLVIGQHYLEPMVTGSVHRHGTMLITCYRFPHVYAGSCVSGDAAAGYTIIPTEINPRLNWGYPTAGYAHMSYVIWQIDLLDTNQGLIEFGLDQTILGQHLPLPWMTVSNWTAVLMGMDSMSHGGIVDLYNLDDSNEDGVITISDYTQPINRLVHNYFEQEVDITNVLREDLFGSASTGITSGFQIKAGGQRPAPYVPCDAHYNHESPRIRITGNIPSPTPAPTPSPTHGPTATPTMTPIPQPFVDLIISSDLFHAGDKFHLEVLIDIPTNFENELFTFVTLLDAYGYYYYHPSWSEVFDYSWLQYPAGTSKMTLLDFNWPEIHGSRSGILIYSALLNHDLTAIVGNWDRVEFGWE